MGCCRIRFPWWLNLDWRIRRRVWLIMCAFELPVTVALLVLFGVADPDTYRTQLWAQGAMLGWNSSPQELLYAAANYQPISAPGPWNQTVTDFGVVSAVLSTFILIVKCVMFVTHTLPPIGSAFVHLGMLIVWCYSASLQAAPDYSDPAHPAAVPWFLSRGCGAPVQQSVVGYCQQAVGAFAITIVEICVFAAYFGLSVAMAIPSKDQKARQAEIEQEKREWEEIENFDDKQFNYELDQMHVPMQTPMTFNFDLPAGQGVLADQQQATQQFHMPGTPGARSSFGASIAETGSSADHQRGTSNRDLPLRHHITSDVYA